MSIWQKHFAKRNVAACSPLELQQTANDEIAKLEDALRAIDGKAKGTDPADADALVRFHTDAAKLASDALK